MTNQIATRTQRRPLLGMTRTRPLALLAAVAISTFAATAHADGEPTAADLSAARALGQEGVTLADGGDCVAASEKLARAEKIFHAPTTLARLGECQIATGRLVEGTESLRRVIREVLPPNAPNAFRAAQERARETLDEATPRIARLKIAVAARADAALTVRVDGEPMPLANLNTDRPMDPGEHVVEASAPGFTKATQKIYLAEGGVDSVAMTLEVDPNAPVASKGGAASGSRLPAYLAFGAGAVSLGVGAAFGLAALSAKSDLDAACRNEICPRSEQNSLGSVKTLATVSTIGFVAGVVGLGAGVYFLLTGRAAPAPATATVRTWIGVSGGGVGGTF